MSRERTCSTTVLLFCFLAGRPPLVIVSWQRRGLCQMLLQLLLELPCSHPSAVQASLQQIWRLRTWRGCCAVFAVRVRPNPRAVRPDRIYCRCAVHANVQFTPSIHTGCLGVWLLPLLHAPPGGPVSASLGVASVADNLPTGCSCKVPCFSSLTCRVPW